jgi:hypothetical protein
MLPVLLEKEILSKMRMLLLERKSLEKCEFTLRNEILSEMQMLLLERKFLVKCGCYF